MAPEELSGPYLEAIRRGFEFARELGQRCGPVHLLVGISAGRGAAAAALRAGRERPLREVVASAGGAPGDGAAFRRGPASYLHGQAQGGARLFADSLGQRPAPEHLLIALLDQGTAEILRALSRAGVDPAAARRAVLAAIGAPEGQPLLTLPPLAPAGTMDRPPLAAEQLDGRAWRVLRWRQDHLPLDRLHGRADWQALSRLEQKAAWRTADRFGLDDDQRYSLTRHHGAQVKQRMAAARPDLAGPPRVPGRPVRRHAYLNVTVGWGVWLRNRQADLRCFRRFRLRTTRYYRGAPQA